MDYRLRYVGALALLVATANLAIAQNIPTLTEKSIPCGEFKKLPNGDWILKGPVLASIGSVTNMTLQNYTISPTTILGGVNLHSLLEKNCGPPE